MAARTPLFRIVQRSFAEARWSLATGRAPEEIGELRRAALSRRDFLRASAVTAVGLAAGCAPARRPPRGRPGRGEGGDGTVVVVGAGIAGLTTAYRLRQEGVPVRVLEAQDRVGGRMYSLRDVFPDGQVAELGGELIDSGHTAIRGLAAELGIALDDLSTDDPALARDVWWFGGHARGEDEVVRAFLPVARRIQADLDTLTGDVTYRTPSGAEALDRTPLSAWLDAAGVEGWFRDLLDVAYTTEYGLETDRQSALNLLLLIDPDPDPFHVFGDSDERFHVHQGNDAIPHELARRLGDAVETGSRLEALRQLADGSFVLSVARGAGAVEVPAAQVVLAIPFTLLRQVRLDVELPPAKRRAIAELGYGTNAKLMAGFSERVWRTRHGSNGSLFTDLPPQTTWETSRLQAGEHGILTNFTGGDHGVELGRGTPEEQGDRLVADLDRVFPGAAAAHAGQRVARFHWPTFPWTLGSYASYLTGQWTTIAGAEGERVGRLHFAGEHCSLAAQGFMEGGCETGEAVAREILHARGMERPHELEERRPQGLRRAG